MSMPWRYTASAMATLDDERQRFFTEGTAEARASYQAAVRREFNEGHDYVDGICGENPYDCGGWTYDPPCGGCVRCLHMQWSHAMEEYRMEAEAWA